MQRLFGTDGIRGRAGEFPLDRPTTAKIGASLGRLFFEKLDREPRFVIGRDTRESGEWIERAIASSAAGAGAAIDSAGVITTPGVAYLAGAGGYDAGIVISASHNPFEDNGIKVFHPDGKKLDEASERRIEADISAESEAETVELPPFDTELRNRLHKEYLDHLAGEVEGLDLKGVNVIADCANGAASVFAHELLARLGAAATVINNLPDGRNINKDCGSLHLEALRAAVVAQGADIGVAFDGDADRALFIDEKGDIVDGDATLWILARRMHQQGKLGGSRVIATVMSNVGLEIALGSLGIELVRTAVGDKYVLEELLRSGASVGGEQSGHIILPHESLVGDGMLTMLFLLAALRDENKLLSEAVEGFVRYPQVLVNVRVREKRPFDDVEAIASAARLIEAELAGSGRLLLRYSGTENLARVMIEGRDQAEIEEKADRLAKVIKTELG